MPKPPAKPAKSPATKAAAPKTATDAPRSRLIRTDPPKRGRAPAVKAKTPAPKSEPRSQCPINLALEMVGDAWSLLIIRDLMLRGHTGYQAFLKSGEKIATNILADRLQKLEQNGLITKAADPADARKFIYALSEKGADLAPLIVELTLFSHRHTSRIDMPKDVLAEMLRNKQAFATRLTRSCAPRKPSRPKSRPQAQETVEETLSLF